MNIRYLLLLLTLICFNSVNSQTWTTQQVGIANTFMRNMFFINSTTGYSTWGEVHLAR